MAINTGNVRNVRYIILKNSNIWVSIRSLQFAYFGINSCKNHVDIISVHVMQVNRYFNEVGEYYMRYFAFPTIHTGIVDDSPYLQHTKDIV